MILYFKLALTLLSLVLTALVLLPGVQRTAARVSWPWLVHGYYILRLVLLVVVVFAFRFGYPKWNVSFYYFEGTEVLNGLLPDRDFYHPYAPLFPYFLGGALAIYKGFFSILVLFQVVEWMGISLLVGASGQERGVRAFLLYAVNPVTLVFFWLGAEQNSFCLLGLALALFWRAPIANGIGAGIGLMISKVLALWFLIPVFLVRGWAMRLVFLATCAVIALSFLLQGSVVMTSKITFPDGGLKDQSTLHTAGSIWEFFPAAGPEVCRLGVMTAIACVALLVALRHFSRHGFGPNPSDTDAEIFIGFAAVSLIYTFQVFFADVVSDYLCPANWLVPALLFRNAIGRFEMWLFAISSTLAVSCELLFYHSAEYAGTTGLLDQIYFVVRHGTPLVGLAVLVRFLYLLWRPALAVSST